MSVTDGMSPEERAAFDEWARFQRETNIKAMAESAMVCSIYPGVEKVDVGYMLQVGAAVLLDKPILVLVDRGNRDEVPPKLAEVADEIIEIDADQLDLGTPELGRRIAAFAARHTKGRAP